MKKIQWLLLSLFSICVVVLSDEGQTLITTNGQFSGCIRHLSHFINRHKAYHLSLDVINASNLKATIGGVEIDNNVLLAATAMTGDDNRVLALYCKGTKIYVKQSVDNGLNWPTLSSIDFPTGDDAVYGIDAVYIPGTILLHVVYSTGHSGVDPEVYFKTYNISTNTWVNEQTITDESNMYGKYPSIALSNGKIHVSFTKAQGEFGETRVRERFNNSSIWDISYDVSALAGSSGTASITVVGDYLNILVNGQSGSEIQVHHLKRHISTGIQTTPIQLSNRSISQQPVKIVKLANGYVVAVFTENFGNRENLSFFTFDGALWVYIGSVAWGPPPDGDIVGWAVCANGNDVGYFRVHRSCGQGFGKLDWYPVTPNNVSVSTSSGIQVQWSSNPELDIQLYEVWEENRFIIL